MAFNTASSERNETECLVFLEENVFIQRTLEDVVVAKRLSEKNRAVVYHVVPFR